MPAEIGLAQAILESGLDGTARSRANALGFCQWLRRNWQHLNRLSPAVIEAYNQTTQAPYCAAYLSILGDHVRQLHPGAVGAPLGRRQRGPRRSSTASGWAASTLARAVPHGLAVRARPAEHRRCSGYRDLYRTYGLRSFRYAEMVFGNTINVQRIRAEVPQERIFAMRTPRADSDRRDHQPHQAHGRPKCSASTPR